MSANIFGSAEDISATAQTTETGTIRSGRTRGFGVYLDSCTASGDCNLRDGGSCGTLKFKVITPAAVGGISINFPGPILFENDVYCNFTTEHVIEATVFHSK